MTSIYQAEAGNMTSTYERCVESASGNIDALTRCVTKALTDQHEGLAAQIHALNSATYRTDDADNNTTDKMLFSRDLFLLFAAALVFFMQAGFAMICAGAVRNKNLQNTMLKNILDACGASISFFVFGYAFAFGGDDDPHFDYQPIHSVIGTANFFLIDLNNFHGWLFQYNFAAASATIIAGTLVERCQMKAYIYYSIFVSGFVYPIVAHAIWSKPGFLSPFADDPFLDVGVLDYAGSSVVHITGGVTALIATFVLGPRRGRFHEDITGERLEKPRKITGNSVSLQVVGTFILWFGWYGFNIGSALLLDDGTADSASYEIAALAATNTTLSAGVAGIVALVVNYIQLDIRKGVTVYDLLPAMNGIISGLVAISAGCGIVEPIVAVITGAGAGLMYLLGSHLMLYFRLDDAVDGIPVHLGGGMWGMFVVGIFASPSRLEDVYGASSHPGLAYSIGEDHVDATLLAAQITGVVFTLLWATCMMWPFFTVLDCFGWLRSSPRDELAGLDKTFDRGVLDGVVSSGFVNSLPKAQLEMYRTMVRQTLESGKIGDKRLNGAELDALREQSNAIFSVRTRQRGTR